ncbi:FxsB family cyclophane-forming radical SAM/SPASM peptide maturase [Streptomyces sp. CS057]|uniref:FxsB family cyclophane-forming radical SAM/SPASM peptide maturase n=1 Tax=Streptomyces sp. CS057 TaxID=1982764 RepID=UPI000B41CDC8|nr:FxsB family cyclophane-forming radical SAM/SPASM peptide maturase [Streptomyces sp. CS057]OWA24993.1 FxsB family radical SAM/SPASM domain protein [Streptomyces sp. CS057]
MTAETLPQWPHRTLSGAGSASVPLRQFVIKVHSRCNLACTYCYVYRSPDQSWRERPVRVAPETMARTAQRIGEHAHTHGLRRIRLELHGGEPLLAGPEPLLEQVRAVRLAVPADCEVASSVQTNGTLLTGPVLDRLATEGIRVGLSLDGGSARLNRRRVGHGGASSWPGVARAADLLARRGGTQYAGILSTIDLNSEPGEVYGSLLELGPPALDFLLPHANWGAPPVGLPPAVPGRHRPGPAPYGQWLAEVFDLWWQAEGVRTEVRLFTEILALLLGWASAAEAVGLSPMVAVVVDTDGAIEQVDSLKSAYPGAPETGLDVFANSFDEALRHPGIAARQLGEEGLAIECRACPVLRVCGGGNYAHRYAPTSGFLHPSVYCADLELLIRHIARRLGGVPGPAGIAGGW